MTLADITVVNGIVAPVSNEAISEVEEALGVTFPHGHREYITALGEGVLGGTYIRIYPPWRVLKENREVQQRWDEYWFWDAGHDVLTKEEALTCIILGDTVDGDELVFQPQRVDRILILPRHSENVYEAGSDLFSAVEWLCSSGVLTESFTERNFEGFGTRPPDSKEPPPAWHE